MPPKTPAKHPAHSLKSSKKAPQKIGKEFNNADAGTSILKKQKQSLPNYVSQKPLLKPNRPAPMLGVYKKT